LVGCLAPSRRCLFSLTGWKRVVPPLKNRPCILDTFFYNMQICFSKREDKYFF
jgi:hypothetical protein